MSTSTTFIGAGFTVQGATSVAAGRVRIRFSSDPRQSNAAAANDGLNPANYTLTGPGIPAVVVSVATVSGDPQSLDLTVSPPLSAGTWNVAAANILTPSSEALAAPADADFVVTDQADATGLINGAENDDPARVIRKHLSQAMAGPTWDALIEALSQGDSINWENARLAFDQLFLTSASGKYLNRLASNNGLGRPPSVGMSDDLFRTLAIKLKNHKLTHEALREILEIFYGRDALRAWVETELEEPFALQDQQTLDWALDETQEFSHTFVSSEFGAIARATAVEVAAALTKTMSDAGSKAVAVAVQDPGTGNFRVRIYSASLGLKSFVRVRGGTAQPWLRFSRYVETYSGTVTSGLGYNWVYSSPRAGVTRLTLATIGAALIDVSAVEAGNYLVIGPGLGSPIPVPPGSYSILDVSYSWSGPTLTQVIDLDADLGVTGTYVQNGNDDYRFFVAEKHSILDGDRTVVVAQTQPGIVKIQIPATTAAVSRAARTGAYVRSQDPLQLRRYYRTVESGIGRTRLELETALGSAPAAAAGLNLSGISVKATRPWVSPGTPGTFPAVGTSAGSWGTAWSVTQDPASTPGEYPGQTLLTNGDALLAGGSRLTVGVDTETAKCNRFRLGASVTVIDGSEADGSLRWQHQWLDTADLNTARMDPGLTTLIDGRALITGGRVAVGTVLDAPEIYDPDETGPGTWTAVTPSGTARVGHLQLTLSNGDVLVCGGATNLGTGTATATAQVFNPGSMLWSSTVNDMGDIRAGFQGLQLNDGRVLVSGGVSHGFIWDGTGILTGGDVLDSCDFYDPGTQTWSPGPRMHWGRTRHQMLLLPDGKVLVWGGWGRDLTQNPPALDVTRPRTYPNQPLLSAEIWDPETNRWQDLPGPSQAYADAAAVHLQGKNLVMVTNSRTSSNHVFYGTLDPDTALDRTCIDVLNLQTLTWSRHFLNNTASRNRGLALSDDVALFSGGNDGSASYDNLDLLIPGADALGPGGLSGDHVVASATTSEIQFLTAAAPYYISSYGDPSLGGGSDWDATTQTYSSYGGSNRYSLATSARSGSTVTLTPELDFAGLSAGDRVFVNVNRSGFANGFVVLDSASATAITYTEAGAGAGSAATTGVVSVDLNPDAEVTMSAAVARSGDDVGPYIYDLDQGLAVTAVDTSLSLALGTGLQVSELKVTSNSGFDAGGGYVVLGLGTAIQSPPIRYIQTLGTDTLVLDYDFVPGHDYGVGTDVVRIQGLDPLVPGPDAGNLYVTGSTAGRVAAQSTTEAAAAAGIEVDFDIIYPGDRGLGGEGLPTESATKLSDITKVFGGDDLDENQ